MRTPKVQCSHLVSRARLRFACLVPGRGVSYLNAPPTDPYVNNSLIRFLSKLKGDKSLNSVRGAKFPLTHYFATLHIRFDA